VNFVTSGDFSSTLIPQTGSITMSNLLVENLVLPPILILCKALVYTAFFVLQQKI
jgi:hypothetical protein